MNTLNITNMLMVLLGAVLILCFVLTLMDEKSNHSITTFPNIIEKFDPVVDAIQAKLQSETPEQLKSTINTLQQRLIDYGYTPDMNSYVKKTDLSVNDGKCLVSNAEDRDKYMSKSDTPVAGPRIDLSQYVKKSSIPPEKICPAQQEIDYSAYVKKSTLPPDVKCPPCISPKVKVSAGLCRECPPAPSCPAPERCPQLICPEPAPCSPAPTCVKCEEVRYIKVPTLITKTVTVDSNGNVVSQKIDSGTVTTNAATEPFTTKPFTTIPSTTQAFTTLLQQQLQQQLQKQPSITYASQIPYTTFPTMSSYIPNITLAQTLESTNGSKKAFCPNSELNSEFKKFGIYGR